jgi:hypothetical protein
MKVPVAPDARWEHHVRIEAYVDCLDETGELAIRDYVTYVNRWCPSQAQNERLSVVSL